MLFLYARSVRHVWHMQTTAHILNVAQDKLAGRLAGRPKPPPPLPPPRWLAQLRNTRNTRGTRSTKAKVEATARYASHMENGGNEQNGCFHDVRYVRKPPGPGTTKLYGFIFDQQKTLIPFCAW